MSTTHKIWLVICLSVGLVSFVAGRWSVSPSTDWLPRIVGGSSAKESADHMPHRAGAHDRPTGNGAQSFQEKLSSPFPISKVADSPQDQKDSGTQLTPEMIAQHEKDREELKKTIGSLLKEDGFSDAEIKSQLEVLVPADDLALEKYPEPPLENTPEVVGKEVENAPPDAGDLPGAEIDPTTDSFPPPPPMPELEAEVK